MSADDDLPPEVQVLERGPIHVDSDTSADVLADEFGQRLEALLSAYQLSPTPSGWRSLALRLALDHEVVEGVRPLQVITPVDRREKIGGIEPGAVWSLAIQVRKRARALGSVKKAAEEFSKKSAQSTRRLQNLVADLNAGRLSKPRHLQKMPWDAWLRGVLDRAANAVEDRSR